jgi:NAD(P)-dependent dehydrogenase (short-subunit alcohol dehydrogenase family)
MPNQDQKKIALITGANKGIGLETARQLARDHGHTVLIGARDKTRGEEATAKLRAEGLDVHFLAIDPTDDASVTAAVKEVDSRFRRIDVLINNAGSRQYDDD